MVPALAYHEAVRDGLRVETDSATNQVAKIFNQRLVTLSETT